MATRKEAEGFINLRNINDTSHLYIITGLELKQSTIRMIR